MLLNHSRMDFVAPRTFDILPVAQFLAESSQLKPDQAVSDSDWQYRVCLCLCWVSLIEL